MDRALPGWAVDLMRDGVDRRSLAHSGDRAVWSALVRTAMSACQRGWSDLHWDGEVTDPRSRLGHQARLKRGKPRGPADVRRLLADAWDAAVAATSERPGAWHTREQAETAARQLAAEVRDFAADPDVPLDDLDRGVLAHAADAARRHGSITPALPLRGVAAAGRVSQRQARHALDRLGAAGLLIRTDPGRSGQARRRAALYRLPTQTAREAYLYPRTGLCSAAAPGAQVCAPPTGSTLAPGAQVCAPPTDPGGPMSEVTLTITARNLAAVLDAIRGAGVQVDEPAETDTATGDTSEAGQVVPIRRTTPGRRSG